MLSGNNAVTTPALYVEGGTLSGNKTSSPSSICPPVAAAEAGRAPLRACISTTTSGRQVTGGIVSGNLTVHGNLYAYSNAVISPGTTTALGTILVDNAANNGGGTITMDSKTTLNFKVGPANSCDQMIASGDMTLAGTLNVTGLSGFGLAPTRSSVTGRWSATR